MNEYLFDTSALRSLPGRDLQRLLDQGNQLYASPYCFWELICHLDEPSRFEYQKAQLIKFRYFGILDDPRVAFENVLSLIDSERVPDNDIIEAVLAALQNAADLTGFYSSYIQDTKGNIRQIAESALRARETLDMLEREYIDLISKIMERFNTLAVDLDAPDIQNNLILSLVEGEITKLIHRGATGDKLRQATIDNTYVYYAYIFYRALRYYKRGKTNIDTNDFGDANICRHLNLRTPRHLITGDKGTLEALENTRSLLQQFKELVIVHWGV